MSEVRDGRCLWFGGGVTERRKSQFTSSTFLRRSRRVTSPVHLGFRLQVGDFKHLGVLVMGPPQRPLVQETLCINSSDPEVKTYQWYLQHGPSVWMRTAATRAKLSITCPTQKCRDSHPDVQQRLGAEPVEVDTAWQRSRGPSPGCHESGSAAAGTTVQMLTCSSA